jgi:recombination protein RecA
VGPDPEEGAAVADDKNKQKALELAIGSIEKEFGRGSIMRLAEGQKIGGDVAAVSTGSLGLDVGLGIGGYPRGRIVEIYGPESSGKTTLTLHAISSIQRLGGVAAFIDAEHALDVTYARRLGVKTEELLISQPDYGEQALEIADMLVSSNAVDIVIIDSVAALVPKAEIEGEMGDSHVGLQARLMSQALRKLTGTVARSKCVLMFTNQIRMKIGVMFGSPETTTGGNALKFYASQRLDIRRIGAIKENSKDKKGEMVVVGNRTRVKVVKNKMAPPFREAEFDILYGKGVSRSGEVVDMAVDLNFIQKSGAWYSVGSERIGQGRDNARAYLDEHPDTMAKLEAQILAHYEIGKVEAGKPEAGKSEAGFGKAEPSKDGKAESSASNALSSGTASASRGRSKSIDDDDDDTDDDLSIKPKAASKAALSNAESKLEVPKAEAAKVAANGTSPRAAAVPVKRPGVRAN